MSNVGQVIADPDFAKLSSQEQQGVLSRFDPQFSKISPAEFPAVVEGIRNKAGTASTGATAQPAASPSQQSYLSKSLNPTDSVASPGEASYVAQADPESRSRMLTASIIGASGGAGEVAAGAKAVAQAAAAAPEMETVGTVAANALKGVISAAKNQPIRTTVLFLAQVANWLHDNYVANATRKEAQENADAISDQLDQIQRDLDAKRKR